MRALRQHPVVVAMTSALLVLPAVAGPVQAAPAPWLTASPTSSPIAIVAGGSAAITITNTDRRASTSALAVTLARSPASAPFANWIDGCTGTILRPGGSCTVEVGYAGPHPTADHAARLTVSSGKPVKASVSRVIEVGVTFAEVCVAQGGMAGYGGMITVFSTPRAVNDRCDWASSLATAVYNAAFDALSPECFDLGLPTIGYTVTGETGKPAIGCVAS